MKHNVSIERAVLSTVIFDPSEYSEIEKLAKEDFFDIANQNIFEAIRWLEEHEKPIDESLVIRYLQKSKRYDEYALLEVMAANPLSNISAYVPELKELSRLRKLDRIALEIRKLQEDESDSETITSAILGSLDEIEKGSRPETTGITLAEAFKELETMPIRPKFATGIEKMDNVLEGGFEMANLVLVGGEEYAGKTLLVQQILKNVSAGHKTLFFSFELARWKLAKRLKKHDLTSRQVENMSIIDISDTGSDVTDVTRLIKYHVKRGVRFVAIDSQMKLSNNTYKGANDEGRIADTFAKLSKAANQHDICVFLIVQINKEDQKSSKMKVKGSSGADYEADIKIYIKKDDKDDLKRIIRFDKNRQTGRSDSFEMYINQANFTLQEKVGVEVREYKAREEDNLLHSFLGRDN